MRVRALAWRGFAIQPTKARRGESSTRTSTGQLTKPSKSAKNRKRSSGRTRPRSRGRDFRVPSMYVLAQLAGLVLVRHLAERHGVDLARLALAPELLVALLADLLRCFLRRFEVFARI